MTLTEKDMTIYSKSTLLLSTAYLPPIEYFALIAANKFVVEKFETYSKQTYRNRCVILSESGALNLSVPVNKPNGNHTKTGDVLIMNTGKWYFRHWQAICSAYRSSPFFLYYSDELAPFFYGGFTHLFNLNLQLINKLSELLELPIKIKISTLYNKKHIEGIIDLRTRISPKFHPVFDNFPPYTQVFSDRHPFIANLSIIDLLFNLGPESKHYIREIQKYG